MDRQIIGSQTNENGEVVPVWSRRVKMSKIKRLYEDDARGFHDEKLIDDVGFTLLCRCESFIAANEAVGGRPLCPECNEVAGLEGNVAVCPCGWRLPWAAYFKTIQHKQLSGGEDVMGPFRDYVKAFPTARSPREKMVLIDQLIHGFHGYLETLGTEEEDVRRPVGVNLIEGKMGVVVRFLNELTYGPQSTPGLADTYRQWRRGLSANERWYNVPDRQAGPI